MITIDKKIKISEGNHKIEFDVAELPVGEYNVRLVIDAESKLSNEIDFSSWVCDFEIPMGMTFSREEIYGEYDNGIK